MMRSINTNHPTGTWVVRALRVVLVRVPTRDGEQIKHHSRRVRTSQPVEKTLSARGLSHARRLASRDPTIHQPKVLYRIPDPVRSPKRKPHLKPKTYKIH